MSKLQPVVTVSSMEAEYLACFFAIQDVVWIRQLLKDIDLERSRPTCVYIDNQSARQLAMNPVHHQRSKSMSLRSCRIHTTSWMAKNHARYSASMDDTVTIGWRFDIQLTGPPAIMMSTPEVDRRVFLSLPQSESLYTCRSRLLPEYLMHTAGCCDR